MTTPAISTATAPLRAVLFDLDDTLFAERDYLLSGIEAVADYLAPRLARPRAELVGQTQELLAAGRDKLFNRLLAAVGAESPALLDSVVHAYRTHRPHITPFDDVLPALRRLKSAGMKVALVTDGKATVQRNKISALALESWLDAVICTDDLLDGATKPSPRPFEVAANRLQTTPTHAAYVGDDTSKDFLGPRALGMRTVRLDRRLPFPLQSCHDFPTAYLPHVTFANLDDAATWLLAESRGTSG